MKLHISFLLVIFFISGCATIGNTKISAYPKCVKLPDQPTVQDIENYCGPYISITVKIS